MSGMVRLMVMDRSFGDANLKSVLDRMAFGASDDGSAIALPVGEIAEDCDLALRSVQRIQKRLAALGLLHIEREAKGHRTRIYRIDLDRLAEYPLTGVGERRRILRARVDSGADSVRAGNPVDNSAGATKDRGDTVSPLEENGTQVGVTSSARGVTQCHPRGDTDDTPIEDTLNNTEEQISRAREGCAGDCAPARAENQKDGFQERPGRTAAQGEAGATPCGPAEVEKPIPACRVWDDAADRIALTIAGPLARYCIPDGDDGETLTLAVGQAGIGYAVLAWAAPMIEPLVGRRIACVVRSWVPPALLKKGLDRESRLSRTARGWDAVQPRLDDRAWDLWQAARAGGAFETCQGYAEGALPDGFDAEGALVVKVARAALMLDGAGEGALSDALGVPVRLSMGGWVDDAVEVRRKYQRMRAARDKGGAAA